MAAAAGRPLSLHALRGHDEVRKTLARAHERGTLPSSLLIHGPRGVGKQHLALWLARLLVCRSPASGPCERCGPCRMARALEHPDIHWYVPLERPPNVGGDRLADALEDARMQMLADVRADSLWPSYSDKVRGLFLGTVQNIRARAHKRPSMAEGPVFIVGQAELLVPQESSPEGANALLKLLEEPPGQARFILTSSEPGLLLPTIRSRTVPLQVGRIPDEDVMALLVEHRGVTPEVAARAAAVSGGAPGRALGFLPGEEGKLGKLEVVRQRALEVVEAAATPGIAEGCRTALALAPVRARGLNDLFGFVEEWLRDLAAVAAGAPERVVHTDELDRLEALARAGIETADIPLAFSKVEGARELARSNVNPQLLVSGLVRDLRAAFRPRRPLPAAAR